MKKNKKRSLSILLLLTLALSGCGSSAPNNAADSVADSITYSENAASEEGAAMEMAPAEAYPETQEASALAAGSGTAQLASDKIIYTAAAELETLEFDETVDAVYAMVEDYGGFIESSYVSGTNYRTNYYGTGGTRSADFTLRVPRESYGSMTNALSELGNVLYLSSAAQNVTAKYTDTESRLTACRIEEERLFAMLEKAETVEDMLAVESRLTDVRYEIEALTTTLNSLESQVAYSTVTLRIYEVAEITERTVEKSYWQDVGDTLGASLSGVAAFFKGFLKYVIAALPVLLILAVVAVPAALLVRRRKKRSDGDK